MFLVAGPSFSALGDRFVQVQIRLAIDRVGGQLAGVERLVAGRARPGSGTSRRASRSVRYCVQVMLQAVGQHRAFPLASGGGPVASRNPKAMRSSGVEPPSFIIALGQEREPPRDRSRRSSDSSACSGVLVRDRAHHAGLASRGIEVHHRRRRHGALPEGVQAAAVEVLARDPACTRRRRSAPSTSRPADTASPTARRSCPPAGRTIASA